MRRPRTLALIGISAAAILLAAISAGVVWLTQYAPLDGGESAAVGSTNLRRVIPAAPGSGGKTVYLAKAGGRFDFGFQLHNGGALSIRLDGATPGPGPIRLVGLGLQPDPTVMALDGAVAFHSITVHPDEYRFLIVHLQTSCEGMAQASVASLQAIRLRYSYLHLFHGNDLVELPAAINVRC